MGKIQGEEAEGVLGQRVRWTHGGSHACCPAWALEDAEGKGRGAGVSVWIGRLTDSSNIGETGCVTLEQLS